MSSVMDRHCSRAMPCKYIFRKPNPDKTFRFVLRLSLMQFCRLSAQAEFTEGVKKKWKATHAMYERVIHSLCERNDSNSTEMANEWLQHMNVGPQKPELTALLPRLVILLELSQLSHCGRIPIGMSQTCNT
eukprot:scaffold37824_cov22-Prasinocladus_malaysianus.AAC.1